MLRKFRGYTYLYGDAQITRPYIDWQTSERAARIYPLLKELWEGKDIMIVEGDKTCLGIGNDLFQKARSIKRILAPANNAFDYYDDIKQAVLNHYQNELVLLALGPTATVLAADLSSENMQILDVGHVDIEYEWLFDGSNEKSAHTREMCE